MGFLFRRFQRRRGSAASTPVCRIISVIIAMSVMIVIIGMSVIIAHE